VSDPRSFALPGARAQYGPDRFVRVEHIDLRLRPQFAARALDGEVTTYVRAVDGNVRSLRLDAVDMTIVSVRDREGAALSFRASPTELVIDLPDPLAAGDAFAFTIAYRVERPRRGLYFVENPRQIWTQSQDTDARCWLPCFDHPAEKQTTSTTITVPKGWFALGNGALVGRVDGYDETTFRYEQRIPHATYLLTMVAGPFSEIAQSHPRVPVFYYVEPGREADGERAFAATPRMIDVFEGTIGVPYPYERYSQIAVADFIFGGMENTSATTQTDRTLHDERAHLDFSSDGLVSHELAHQWFGDYVTCRDWSHAWLNEGFATYFEAVWAEADRGWDEYQYYVHEIVSRYLDESGERYTRPIVCHLYRDPIELFDRHLYEKAGAVLHSLRGELGWERMRRVLKRYVTDHATGSVETIDLVRAIEAETGRNLRGFFDQWIHRAGHPDLVVSRDWDAERGILTLTFDQRQPVSADQPAYAFDVEIGLLAQVSESLIRDAGPDPLAGERRLRVRIERAQERVAIALDTEPAMIRIDPSAWVLATWKLELGVGALATILARDPSPLARIRAARSLAKDPSVTAQAALIAALSDEPFWGVAAEVARLLGSLRTSAAREALFAACSHAHPKVRRAVASALGNFRDPRVADALLGMRGDASYFVVAAAYEALGKTRDPRAFDALRAALEVRSWNEVIAAGAVRGLAASADERALQPLLAVAGSASPEPLRRAAAEALARVGTLIEGTRAPIIDTLETLFHDPAYLVRLAAYAAAETLGDPRLLGALDRRSVDEVDGRLRRDAAEAAMRVRSEASAPAALAAMREELDRMRDEVARLRERVSEPLA
jgi:aminopeptidase N